MFFFVPGLDAELLRVARLASTQVSLDTELRSGFTNLEVGQSEKADIVPANDNVRTKGDGKADGASKFPEIIHVLPWLPPRPSETPSLQTLEHRIQEKVWTPSGPSALHHQTLRDLVRGLMIRLALQDSSSTSSSPTFCRLEATLLQEVRRILQTQDGISLVLEHLPQCPSYSGTDSMDAMLEAACAELSLAANSSRAQLRSTRYGQAGAICGLAEIIANVICRHAEDRRAPAASDLSVGGSSSSLRQDMRLHDGSTMECSGLEKASETHVEMKADVNVKERCNRFGLVKTRECPFSSRSPEELRSSRKQRAADPGLLKAWEKIDSSSSSASTSQSSSSTGHGKTKLSSLGRWFKLVS